MLISHHLPSLPGEKKIKSGELYLWLVAAFNELRSADAKMEVAGIFTGYFFFVDWCTAV